MSTIFATIVWGPLWEGSSTSTPRHVRFLIDNTTAVAWCNKRASRNPFAQLLLRLQALLEVRYNFYSSTGHIAGETNIMADAGSRVWQSQQMTDHFWFSPDSLERSLRALGALLRTGALAETSLAHYTRGWTQWVTWCQFMGYQPWLNEHDLNNNVAQLGAFAVYLWRFGMNQRGEGNAYSTICGKLCAIRWYHRNTVGYDPGVNASHAILLRFTSPVTKQHPVSPALLLRIYNSINRRARVQLLWGRILLGYFFLLRRSEYLHVGNKFHDYAQRLHDIRLLDAEQHPVHPRLAVKVGIRLSGAKTTIMTEWKSDFTTAQAI
ncbi:hypothetical protein PHMEG_0009108 [Phytophthora megakarya]|uniref:Uncharacterized protein n=1 Tax=Phytophthora megakarya TaxID=4795 RepID=A0A225WH01_9STRA|nr:hypothetical protein PHMEG_0009108 [Phytophthora megakarya]